MASYALLVLVAVLLDGASALRNSALVFLKPHAANDKCETFLREHLQAAGIHTFDTAVKEAAEIDGQKLIDQHYGALARIAMETQPADMSLGADAAAAFKAAYGKPWSEALPSMRRNPEALESLGVSAEELERLWRGGVQVKLAPGTYVSRLASSGPTDVFTLNGFYPSMRAKFVEAGASVRCIVCEWDDAELPWRAFRRDVIGATDPVDAAPGSARAELRSRWRELGLDEEPSMALNGVHASAGPLEGLKERCVWAGASMSTDEFGSALLTGGLSEDTLGSWLADNPVVTLGGESDKVFDLTEEMGTDEVLELVKASMATPQSVP